MSVFPIVEATLTLAAFALGLCGCWVLHARQRNAGSLLLLLSLIAFVGYCLFSQLLADPLLRIVESRAPRLAYEAAWAAHAMIPLLLCLCAAVSFLAAARSIRR
jgi:hypothetical protein